MPNGPPAQRQTISMSRIETFISDYGDKFTVTGLSSEDRAALLGSISLALEPNSSTCDSQKIVTALSAIRILSRDKLNIDRWFDEAIFCQLMRHSGLQHYREEGRVVLLPDNVDMGIVTEAMKCLCNLTFNNNTVQSLCAKERCVLSIIQRARTYTDESIHPEVKFYDMRLMFLITALVKTVRTQAMLEWEAMPVLADILQDMTSSTKDLSDSEADLAVEVLKAAYNLTLPISPWDDEFFPLESSLTRLVSEIRNLLCHSWATKEKHLEIIKHSSNLFTTLPVFTAHFLIPCHDESAAAAVARSFQGYDVSAIVEILRYLEVVLEDTTIASQRDRVLPLVTALTHLSRSDRIIRKYCRLRILPHLRDEVKRLPEEGDSLRNRLCKLLTTPNTEVKQVVADLLYVVCKENVSRLIKYSGFGNAAGLLAQYGLMRGSKVTPTADYSDDSDSETEEYKELEPDINPVTGRYETGKTDPMAGMSEEQKEYEAMQLINAMDRLQRLGVVQPSTIGSDGKPVPVEHVLQLAQDPASDENTD
ncbi:synembryn-A-like [Watersipora subatra]|uniref:synembryn-A-like n=1 Tax=Watersipora subatra TaxID=2589382 RepID=UPI00355B4E1A